MGEGSHKVRRFSLERSVLKRLFAVAAVLSIGFFLLVFDYLQTNLDQAEENRKEIDEIKSEYLEGLRFHFVRTIKEVLDVALLKQKVDDPLKLE